MFDDPFQAGVITFFIVAAVAGVAIFAISPNLFGGGQNQQPATVTIWGTVSSEDMNAVLSDAGIRDQELLTVNYANVSADNLRNRLVNALARDEGPDALLMPHTQLLQLEEFLIPFGSQTYSPREFRNNFVEGAEVFLQPDGVTALPFAMDPLVMYWNRDMLSSAGFVSPPENWNQVSNYVQAITEVDDADNINRSAIALGTARNITHSKEVLSALFLQAENPVVTTDSSGDPANGLTQPPENARQAEAALRLYTQFANPATATYTWNNNLPQDRRAFASNQVAMYFDTGQAIADVRNRNPNLNFDVARIPQRANGQPRTYARMYGLALLDRVAPQRRTRVLSALQQLTSSSVAESTLANTNLTPVHKQVVSEANPEEAYKATLLDAAVTARAWLDPNPEQTDRVFADMIVDVISGQSSVSEAVDTASRSLNALLDN